MGCQAGASPVQGHRLRGFSSARVGGRRTRSGHDAHPGCLSDALPRSFCCSQAARPHRRCTRSVEVRAILGPNLHTIISGGAPLALDLANFYRGLGITLLQGYGLSETTGPISVETPQDFPPDSVGFPWPGNQMMIAPDGELLVRGISVSKGYHNLPEATAEAYVDGWFKTGDLASIDDRGHLRITGRKKELIVTAGGKNVSPEILEESLSTHPLIANIVVVGDNRPYIGALIALTRKCCPSGWPLTVCPSWTRHRRRTCPRCATRSRRRSPAPNKAVSRAESIRRYRIVNAAFTVENGYMTPSLKLKRRRVLADYADEVDALYASGEAREDPEEPGVARPPAREHPLCDSAPASSL